MAEGGGNSSDVLLQEFERWQEETASEAIFLLESKPNGDGSCCLQMLLGSEHEYKLLCPAGYPQHSDHFFVESDQMITIWANALNEYLLDSCKRLLLSDVLNKAVSLYSNELKSCMRKSSEEISEDDDMSPEEDDHEGMLLSDDDSAFTTEWELKVARKKKRWAQKEMEVREEMKRAKITGPSTSDLALQASGQEKEQARQIFTGCAASGILTNDLVKIMESEKEVGFTADPIDDNIYQWSVKLFNFKADSPLAKELDVINSKFGYNYIELELDFAIDLYPFYPPLVKVIRPRMQGSMMQRVTNMEILKLSYWNPAKDMKCVLIDIKEFLQQWARLEENSERNDSIRYPSGSYVDIEHHLLRLALTSEINPRANKKYVVEVEKIPDLKPAVSSMDSCKEEGDEYWAAGTGYGHSKRPEWDINAYLAAQKEKDKQIEYVLHRILHDLKVLYANHAPQLKPRSVQKQSTDPPEASASQSVDPVEDVYNILEGSAIIPFLEQYLRADSFLEICRHTAVYKVIVDIIKEIAMQPQLVGLLGGLPGQAQSVYELLGALEKKANILLAHICKAGNGSIPKPPKEEKQKKNKNSSHTEAQHAVHEESMEPIMCPVGSSCQPSMSDKTAEERLAREFVVLYKDITEAFKRAGIDPEKGGVSGQNSNDVMDISFCDDDNDIQEARYKKIIKEYLFDSHDVEIEGPNVHNYANEFKKQPTPSQTLVFRIAQELTSLSSSLPLELSSSIFVRTDDEKLTLMRALITGPEGTPYSGGCYQFDIFFPFHYPKTPPLVNLQTTGGGTVRFNPNLYNCGKVCLSLLGTWEGQQGEQWNETTSTVLQVLVSIQSLILVPEPYFNEPGYEREIGTEAGRKHSAEYNENVRFNNIKYAMLNQLKSPSPGFEDVIKAHFYLKRDRIINETAMWLEGDKNGRSVKLEKVVHKLRQELRKLEPPKNLTNMVAATPSSSSSATSTESDLRIAHC